LTKFVLITTTKVSLSSPKRKSFSRRVVLVLHCREGGMRANEREREKVESTVCGWQMQYTCWHYRKKYTRGSSRTLIMLLSFFFDSASLGSIIFKFQKDVIFSTSTNKLNQLYKIDGDIVDFDVAWTWRAIEISRTVWCNFISPHTCEWTQFCIHEKKTIFPLFYFCNVIFQSKKYRDERFLFCAHNAQHSLSVCRISLNIATIGWFFLSLHRKLSLPSLNYCVCVSVCICFIGWCEEREKEITAISLMNCWCYLHTPQLISIELDSTHIWRMPFHSFTANRKVLLINFLRVSHTVLFAAFKLISCDSDSWKESIWREVFSLHLCY
jgi:hypothetical protein